MHNDYRSSTIRSLRDDLVGSTSERLVHYAAAAEALVRKLDPHRSYTFSFVFRKIKGATLPDEGAPSGQLACADIRHDLRLLIEDLTDVAAQTVSEVDERVLTVEELSKLFHVSTKTISRWRQQGLVARKFVFDGRKRVGFLKSSVERFVAGNPERIQRGSRFRQMTGDERVQIVQSARDLSTSGLGLNDIANRLAEEMQRSPGTIRGTIKQHDRDNPEEAIFPRSSGPLSEDVRKKIFRQYLEGQTAEELAGQYGRTKTTMYRIISRMRYERIMELPLEFVENPQFPRVRNDRAIVGPTPEAETPTRKPRAPRDLPSYLASLYEVPLLTREQEQHVFRKFNYLKYRAGRLREKLNAERPQMRLMDQIERLYDEAVTMKNQIVRANLRLVVSIAKRHVGPQENFFELVSDGNISLIRAVEKFDFSRGFKFSTYASWAIMKNFARSIPDQLKQRDRFRTSNDEMFAVTEEHRGDWFGEEIAHRQHVREVTKILDRLDEREQKIIIHRFGLDYTKEPQTLKQVGESMGVTKERVRQIEARALNKLRAAAEEQKIDLP